MARPFLVVAVDVKGSIFVMMMARRVGLQLAVAVDMYLHITL